MVAAVGWIIERGIIRLSRVGDNGKPRVSQTTECTNTL